MRPFDTASIHGPRRRARRAAAALVFAASPCPCAGQCVPEWSNLGTNIDGGVFGLSPAWGNLGSQYPAYLAVSGDGETAGTILDRQIALWDGWTWRVPGGGMTLAWTAFDVEAPRGPSATLTFFVGGSLGLAGTVPVNNIAQWAGGWSNPGGGIPTGYIKTLFWCDAPPPLGPAVYVGGPFGNVGEPTRGLIRWDGQSWAALGTGIWNTHPLSTPKAGAFAVYDDDGPGPRSTALYVGGSFTFAGGVEVHNLGRWDGVAWESVGGGTDAVITALAVFDHDGPGPERASLFATGQMNYAAGTVFIDGLGRWDGAQWHAIPGWTGNSPDALAVFDDDGPGPNKPALYVAGLSVTAAGIPTNGKVLKWDGTTWDNLDGGISGAPFGSPTIFAIDAFDEDGAGPNPGGLYVGGHFNDAGGKPAPRIARWGCPLPARCDANCNRDFHPVTGQPILTVADFGCFQTRFVLKDPYGDCNEDGELTVADFGCFQTKFVSGCP